MFETSEAKPKASDTLANFWNLNFGHISILGTIVVGGWQTLSVIEQGQANLEYRVTQIEQVVKKNDDLTLKIVNLEYRLTTVERRIDDGRSDRLAFQKDTAAELSKIKEMLNELKNTRP